MIFVFNINGLNRTNIAVSRMERVQLNVGGSIFVTLKSTLSKIPNTRLSNLDKNCPEYDAVNDEYFFDRNPHAFVSILDLYRTSELHIPSNACGISLRSELDYWDINPMRMSKCCWKTYLRVEEDMEIMNNISIKFGEINLTNDEVVSTHESFKSRLWQSLEHPHSSSGAKVTTQFTRLIKYDALFNSCIIVQDEHRALFKSSNRLYCPLLMRPYIFALSIEATTCIDPC